MSKCDASLATLAHECARRLRSSVDATWAYDVTMGQWVTRIWARGRTMPIGPINEEDLRLSLAAISSKYLSDLAARIENAPASEPPAHWPLNGHWARAVVASLGDHARATVGCLIEDW